MTANIEDVPEGTLERYIESLLDAADTAQPAQAGIYLLEALVLAVVELEQTIKSLVQSRDSD